MSAFFKGFIWLFIMKHSDYKKINKNIAVSLLHDLKLRLLLENYNDGKWAVDQLYKFMINMPECWASDYIGEESNEKIL